MNLPNGYTLDNLKRTQNRLLEMAKITAKILTENGFKYLISFGTLLGAVRHQGFIPWDDDFDMFLFDDEYEEAIKCLRKNLPNDIVLHDKESDPTYYAAWAKLRDVNSEVHCSKYPDDDKHLYKGINVDLYRLKRVPRNMADEYICRSHLEFLVRKNDAGFLDPLSYSTKFKNMIEEYNTNVHWPATTDDTRDDVFAFLILVYKLEINDVLPLKQYTFEGTTFYGPNNYDAILRQAYGDYMSYPSFESRRPHCDSVKFFDEGE